MRFMVMRKADKNTEAGAMPSEQLVADMMSYNEELINAGAMLAGEGLQPSSKGARVKFSGGKSTVIDGPFAEAKELIAGFSILDVKSKEELIEILKRWPASDLVDGAVELEIRQFFEVSDFPPSEAVEQHRRVQERLEKK